MTPGQGGNLSAGTGPCVVPRKQQVHVDVPAPTSPQGQPWCPQGAAIARCGENGLETVVETAVVQDGVSV